MKRLLLVSMMTTLSFNAYAMKRNCSFMPEKLPASQQKRCRATLITTENATEIAKLSNGTITVINYNDYYASILLELKHSQSEQTIPAPQPIPAIIITPDPTESKNCFNNTKKQTTPNKNRLQTHKRR